MVRGCTMNFVRKGRSLGTLNGEGLEEGPIDKVIMCI
jgi:hypothetical protein